MTTKPTTTLHTLARLAAAAAVALAAACTGSDDDRQATDGLQPISIATTVDAAPVPAVSTAGLAATRAASAAVTYTTQLPAGETFYAHFTGGANIEATTYRADGTGGGTPVQQPYFAPGMTRATVEAYYPYEQATPAATYDNALKRVTHLTPTFTVEADQTATLGYKRSDLMYAAAAAATPTAPAALAFRHLTAQLQIVVSPATAAVGNVTRVAVVTGYRTANITRTSGAALGTTLTDPIGRSFAAGTADNSAPALVAYSDATGTAAELTALCLLPPQTLKAKTDLIAVTTTGGGTQYFRTGDADMTLLAGHAYRLTLTPGRPGLTLTVSDAGWTEDDVTSNTSRQPQTLTFNLPGATFNMRFVKGGSFTMEAQNRGIASGSTTVENAWYDNDTSHPAPYTITGSLSDYYIGETEVTTALWQAVIGSNPLSRTGDMPLAWRGWDATQTFIAQLNSATVGQRPDGWEFRLTTDMQWMYAARGGQTAIAASTFNDAYPGFANIDQRDQYGVIGRTDDVKPIANVGTKLPNELGLYDMAGNCWEICSDYYGPLVANDATDRTIDVGHNYKGPASGENAKGEANDNCRVFHGGSYQFCGTNYVAAKCGARVSATASNPSSGDWSFRLALVRTSD